MRPSGSTNVPPSTAPVLQVPPVDASFALKGIVGDWLATVLDNWLLPFLLGNPAMMQVFRDRERSLKAKPDYDEPGTNAAKYLLGRWASGK